MIFLHNVVRYNSTYIKIIYHTFRTDTHHTFFFNCLFISFFLLNRRFSFPEVCIGPFNLILDEIASAYFLLRPRRYSLSDCSHFIPLFVNKTVRAETERDMHASAEHCRFFAGLFSERRSIRENNKRTGVRNAKRPWQKRSLYSLSNKISLLATTLASRVFGLFGFCWSPESGTGPETGAGPLVAKLAACGSPPLGDIAPFALCSVFSFFGSATEKKNSAPSEWCFLMVRERERPTIDLPSSVFRFRNLDKRARSEKSIVESPGTRAASA